ncbi:hypothetical protein FKP32DRAFT_1389140 [Trametes sanguinea]|nr:hypothetical protein FKP32DRAFT_1389140 [Trametes sanguinea]
MLGQPSRGSSPPLPRSHGQAERAYDPTRCATMGRTRWRVERCAVPGADAAVRVVLGASDHDARRVHVHVSARDATPKRPLHNACVRRSGILRCSCDNSARKTQMGSCTGRWPDGGTMGSSCSGPVARRAMQKGRLSRHAARRPSVPAFSAAT